MLFSFFQTGLTGVTGEKNPVDPVNPVQINFFLSAKDREPQKACQETARQNKSADPDT